ncbi:S9 family peptidase [Haliea sp. E1-2-M8]|uniref:S9 family peptidase n=1 Tax=Haliea sp. E1-2-M8 TaxID=3064706 RepID=UPI00271DA7BF|nr:S9 family peptidase [Haliea sp. E1-2-M8]MDO8861178.1 S9 family peptidase [Haliea sp. E1-2-M8]
MNLRNKMVALVCLVLCYPPLGQSAGLRPLSVDDIHAVADVSEPAVSPDGKQVAYVVSVHNLEQDAIVSDVWQVPWAGGEPRQLTAVDSVSASTPKFSPDGRYLAYLEAAGDEAYSQVFLLDRRGGEVRQLTAMAGGVVDYDWAPDSSQLVVASFVGGAEPNAAGTAAPVVIERFQFLEDGVGYLAGARRQLSIVDLQGGATRQLTRGDQDHWLPSWSPDGRYIAYVSKDKGNDPDRNMDSDVFVIPASGEGAPRRISDFDGTDVDPYWMSPPAWSPDSKQLAWLQSGASKWIYYAPWQLTVADLATATNRPLARVDRNFFVPKWSADGRYIYALQEDPLSTWLVRIDSDNGDMTRLSTGKRFALDFALGGEDDHLVLLDSTDNRPFELFAVEGETLRPLTQHNAWLDEVQLAVTRTFSFENDGHSLDGFLVLPADADPAIPLPTIFRLHGGPVYQFSHEFMVDWQLYAAAGFAVVGINPRGSSGKGFDFAAAIYADWGNVDVSDIHAGVEYLQGQGIIDPSRLGVGGWSYGAILTNSMIAADSRFRAAVSGAGVSNIYGSYGLDQYSREYELELGTPWSNRENYDRASYPFLNADRITTPTLYQCAGSDLNVPCSGSLQMYQALRSLGVPTQLVIYPEQNHSLQVPSYLRDRMQRNLDWYQRWLAATPAP